MSGCYASPVNKSVNTEGGRVALLLEAARICAVNTAVARARAAVPVPTIYNTNVPRSSDRTASIACMNYVSPNTFIPESARIANLQKAATEKEKDPLNPETRFAAYKRPIPPPVCQPVPQEALNANVPKTQARPCPLVKQRYIGILP